MNFLLEIGTEEIPHWMIPGALTQLAKLDLFGAIPQVDATPRRLVVRAENLPDRTPDQEQLVKGPPISAGDKAAAGFAKKQGVDLSAMQKVGDYYELRKQIPGRPVRDLLAESLPGSILGIQWPKTMYWGAKGSPRFIRPIRWIVALINDEIIDFEVAGVRSGNVTSVHRMYSGVHPMYTYATIEAVLRSHQVILSASERRQKIEQEAKALGATIDPELLETLTYITECPAAIKGDFDPAYLELPAEVLTTVMRHHQKYFAVETAPGVLAPHFVAIMNIPSDPDGLVKQGNERVLKARFNDARFFWQVDQKKKLADRVEDLSHVTFQAKLGTYLDKTHRVVALVKEIAGDPEGKPDWMLQTDADAARAAWLSKADLTTEMVKEFTDLQGIVGGLYAKHQGENQDVATAIYEHYKPLSMEDSVPLTRAGQILALADKLDNLREFFRIGMEPTGSKDPFALRRAAQGVVRILVERDFPVELAKFCDGPLLAFMMDRVRYYFREVRGFKYDEVNAATAGRHRYLYELERCLEAIRDIRPTEDFERVAASFKRIKNILDQANLKAFHVSDVSESVIDESLIEDGAERDFYNEFHRIVDCEEPGFTYDFSEALAQFASLRPAIDAYFDKVMVNSKCTGAGAYESTHNA